MAGLSIPLSGSLKQALLIAALAIVFQPYPAGAASFDCRKAETPVEKAICKNTQLSKADEDMAKAYQAALGSAHEQWKTKIIEEQREWLRNLSSGFNKSADNQEGELLKALQKRTETLQQYAEREKIVYLKKTPITQDVCSKVLSIQNMTWEGNVANTTAGDSFELKVPNEVETVQWLPFAGLSTQAKFDFLNTGKDIEVYRIEIQTSHYEYTWYIVPTSQEKAAIKHRLRSASTDDDYADLVTDLKNEAPIKLDVVGGYTAAEPPRYLSRLFDASTTGLYRGWYSRSRVVRYKGVTYLIAESVNNLLGPTFSIFEPQSPGKLQPLCYYRASPSLVIETRNQLDSKFHCPADQSAIPTSLDLHPCEDNSGLVYLKEWGGERPVIQKISGLGPPVCGWTTIKVGNIGEKQVEKNTWEPTNALEDSQGKLLVTQDGPYIITNQESGESYYRITDNSLMPVCSVSRSTLPPPGYTVGESADLAE